MTADRAQHVAEVVRPALAAGRHVVSDRYVGSTLAYQGFGRGLPVDDLRRLSGWAAAGLRPDLVVLLDVPPDLGSTRAAGRADPAPDRVEAAGDGFHDRVMRGYRALAAADPTRWVVVDGTAPVDDVEAVVGRGHRPLPGAGERRRWWWAFRPEVIGSTSGARGHRFRIRNHGLILGLVETMTSPTAPARDSDQWRDVVDQAGAIRQLEGGGAGAGPRLPAGGARRARASGRWPGASPRRSWPGRMPPTTTASATCAWRWPSSIPTCGSSSPRA